MEYISTSLLARNNNLVPADLFFALDNKGFIVKKGSHWLLTQKGSETGGKYRKNDKGEQWIVWSEYFNIKALGKITLKKTSGSSVKSTTKAINKMKLLCLSNSFKEGGRCIAGIKISENNVLIKDGKRKRPVWIRPVCKTAHEEIPNDIATPFQYYDILEFSPEPNWIREDYQSENLRILNNSITRIGTLNSTKLDNYCDNDKFNKIFGNRGKAVSSDKIAKLNYSLIMLRLDVFKIVCVQNYNNQEQVRLIFTFNNNEYDLPITDPVFLHKYRHNSDFINNKRTIYAVISLTVPFNNWYYKLIATVLY